MFFIFKGKNYAEERENDIQLSINNLLRYGKNISFKIVNNYAYQKEQTF